MHALRYHLAYKLNVDLRKFTHIHGRTASEDVFLYWFYDKKQLYIRDKNSLLSHLHHTFSYFLVLFLVFIHQIVKPVVVD